ncbi:MAG: hypothetical protein EBS05_24945, partial [Proteobacteria bacterium]|nr:hypothetical protein [Pseudomonadota bacterium]
PLAFTLAPIVFTPEAEDARISALCLAADVSEVTGPETQVKAVEAQKAIRGVISAVEKARKAQKVPILEAGRKLDAACDKFCEDLKSHELRIATEVGNYQEAEREKVRKAEQAAAAELARIERERQEAVEAAQRAAWKAQQEAEAKAAAERAAAARAAAEERAKIEAEAAKERAKARNDQERAAAEAHAKAAQEQAAQRAEQDRIAAEARAKAEQEAAAARLAAEKQRQDELAAQQIEAVGTVAQPAKVAGQVIKEEWEITEINAFALMRVRPDLVRDVIFDRVEIKRELDRGLTLAGVKGCSQRADCSPQHCAARDYPAFSATTGSAILIMTTPNDGRTALEKGGQ